MTKTIGRTRGNAFVPIERSQKINMYYDYAVAITVFTSILKFCRFEKTEGIEILFLSSTLWSAAVRGD